MIAVTSLAPGHKNNDNQLNAIESWKKAGFEVYSINSKEEIASLSEYDVNFVETKQTGKELYGKPYVKLTAFKEFIEKYGDCLIINSDIIITGDIKKSIKNAENGALILNRYDYDLDISKSTILKSGFDAFYITKENGKVIPETDLALGQCHWDYWLPLVLLRNGVKLYTSKKALIHHKKHDLQYTKESWEKTGYIMMKELGLKGDVSYNSTKAYHKIHSSLNVVW